MKSKFSLLSGALRLVLAGLFWLMALSVTLSVIIATLPVLIIIFLINREVFYRTLNFNMDIPEPSAHPAEPVTDPATEEDRVSGQFSPATPGCNPANSAAY